MTASIPLSLELFTQGMYKYSLTDTQYVGVYRTEEAFSVDNVAIDTSAYIVFISVTDNAGNETRTLQPVVIGVAGDSCTVVPVSDTTLIGHPLSDDNVDSVKLEVVYDE